MKKNLFIIGMGAMALATPLFLSSCSSSDDIADTPATNNNEAVKTSFTLSVGLPGGNNTSSAKPATRMTEDITQAQTTPVFRGMDNMTLIPFNTGAAITTSDSRTGTTNINLPNTTANTLLAGQITSTGNAHVYTDVSVPVGVKSFLFYGKAVDATAGTDASKAADMFNYGSLTTAGLSAGAPSGISFTPKQIYATGTADTKATDLATYLTTIASSSYTDNATTPAEHKWSEVAPDAQGQGSALATLYTNFTSLTAGSSASVQDAAQELYTSLNSLLSGNQTDVNKGIINKIIENIKTGATVDKDGKLSLNSNYTGFPANINLPDGAVTVKCTNGTFTAQTSATYTTDGTQMAALSDYVYPANLWYRANTLIKTSDKVLTDKYVAGSAWDAILQNYDGDGVVKNSTASIALNDQIQYAVGRLKMTVKVANSTLYDGNGETVAVPTEGFPVSAVLIGDQRKVDFQFAPIKTEKQYTIYDKEITGINATTGGSTANNTLVLETPAEENVNVLLELTNNTGKRFKGKNGYIPAGAKFYLLGTLTPSNGKIDGQASTTLNQVFKQDYVTTANFTIQKNSLDASTNPNQDKGLGAAYNVIPDLRTPALSIGLSVDLTWQTGLTFDVDM